MDPVYGLVILALGLGAGFFFGRTENKAARKARALAEELKAAQDELSRHRQQVNEHFMKTGELVTSMTESYRAVYDHLAKGARSLCSGDAARITMITPAEKLIGVSPVNTTAASAAKPARPEHVATGQPSGQRFAGAVPLKSGVAPVKPVPEAKPAERTSSAN